MYIYLYIFIYVYICIYVYIHIHICFIYVIYITLISCTKLQKSAQCPRLAKSFIELMCGTSKQQYQF